MSIDQMNYLLTLARQYLDHEELRNFSALLDMLYTRDARLRSIVEGQLATMIDKIIAEVGKEQQVLRLGVS